MEKKKIVHVINSLGRGGAELMLTSLLKNMNEVYDVVLVTLATIPNESDFLSDEILGTQRYCLNFSSKKDLPAAVYKLRKIIKKHSPVLVRSQLYWSTIICRIATPKCIPLVFSIHSQYSKDVFGANQLSLYLERFTYHKRQTLISVSEAAFNDYASYIKVEGSHYILNNFVSKRFFGKDYDFRNRDLSTIKLVAVGNLKEAKNYMFLLNVIKEVKDKISVTLDIIGEGYLQNELQLFIHTYNLPVRLLGSRVDVDIILSDYDGFVMCSLHEGFGIAPVEAMAVGLPLILNDLDVMKEMSRGNALIYKSNDINSLAQILLGFGDKKEALLKLSSEGKLIAKKYYSQESYFLRLKNIYDKLIS